MCFFPFHGISFLTPGPSSACCHAPVVGGQTLSFFPIVWRRRSTPGTVLCLCRGLARSLVAETAPSLGSLRAWLPLHPLPCLHHHQESPLLLLPGSLCLRITPPNPLLLEWCQASLLSSRVYSCAELSSFPRFFCLVTVDANNKGSSLRFAQPVSPTLSTASPAFNLPHAHAQGRPHQRPLSLPHTLTLKPASACLRPLSDPAAAEETSPCANRHRSLPSFATGKHGRSLHDPPVPSGASTSQRISSLVLLAVVAALGPSPSLRLSGAAPPVATAGALCTRRSLALLPAITTLVLVRGPPLKAPVYLPSSATA